MPHGHMRGMALSLQLQTCWQPPAHDKHLSHHMSSKHTSPKHITSQHITSTSATSAELASQASIAVAGLFQNKQQPSELSCPDRQPPQAAYGVLLRTARIGTPRVPPEMAEERKERTGSPEYPITPLRPQKSSNNCTNTAHIGRDRHTSLYVTFPKAI
eukprot:scaffold162670_cov17-Tisochrysis_lutea.AAC.2